MKKLLSTLLAFVMLATTLMAVPFTAQAGKFPNIELAITSVDSTNGLPVGKSIKAPDGAFKVDCLDNNGYDWEIIYSTSTHWEDSNGNKITATVVEPNTYYTLQLAVRPIYEGGGEDDVDINDVKQITFNGVPLTTSQYVRGELGTSIYIRVEFCYANITGASGAGYYLPGEMVTVTADKAPSGKHFDCWSGAYGAGGKYRWGIDFTDRQSSVTTFKMPNSSFNYVNPVYEDHSPVAIDPVAATCTKAGNTSGVKCSICNEIITAPTAIAAKGHSYKTTTTKATVSKNGSVVTKCTVCGAVKSKSTIYYPKTISLSATSYTYDGKVKTPSVTVKDSKGKTLKKNTDYTVSYAKGRKSVGKYAVKITFKGNYSGTKTLYFYVKPKATSISSVSAGSKKFTVKWKKQATQTTGYQIQYSTNSKFSKAKTVTVGKNSTTSKTVSKLSGKKKYYVRVRTYKTVNGTKIYSSWSKAKTVTTKK